ncbi:MAG: SEC-C domain-containing protein [Bdellovibrionales bacterium]|nr:SEC-C domain-containing protein [Bdellovibrionales bacterium]
MELKRNEPCHCGSGKKYKRCHGIDAPPVLTTPAAAAQTSNSSIPGVPAGGFDPSKMDPAMMTQMMGALQRLPRGQLQKLQSLMQKAMAGKDVSREAQEFERFLPPELKQMAAGFMASQGVGASATTATSGDLDEAEAKKIVQEALAAGKISAEEAAQVLGSDAKKAAPGFWDRIRGKK